MTETFEIRIHPPQVGYQMFEVIGTEIPSSFVAALNVSLRRYFDAEQIQAVGVDACFITVTHEIPEPSGWRHDLYKTLETLLDKPVLITHMTTA